MQGIDGKRMLSLRDWGSRDIEEEWLEMEGTLGGQGEDQAGKTRHGWNQNSSSSAHVRSQAGNELLLCACK